MMSRLRDLLISSISFIMLAIGNVAAICLLALGDVSRNAIGMSFWILLLDVVYAGVLVIYDIFPKIPMGTRSLLVGAHQFLWHPLTVFLSWHDLYGKWPNWKVCVCIFIHDWGYWGCKDMEGKEGWHHA